MKSLLFRLLLLPFLINGQTRSTIEEQSIHYKQYGFESDSLWDIVNGRDPSALNSNRSSVCTLNKKVYGWHPYWSGTVYQNYNWNMLSHLSYFSYEVNPSTGNDQSGTATPAHNFSTAAAVTAALNNNVKVTLCVTLFSNHSTLWASSTAQQTLINNLISMVQARGAHGVNIDFEGMGTADKTPFKNFMVNLCNQMHAQIPGSEVSMALYAVEWSSIFDIAGLSAAVDQFIIMGYDYYYGGSTTAGPTDPLFNFQTSYNYTLSKSVTYYLKQGVPASKLLLGLPYYGREWQTTASTIPSSTVSGGYSGSRTYKYVRDNAATYSNRQWDANSYTPYYVYQTSGQWRQCFIDDAYSLGKRFDLVNLRGLGGIGIWALGYDDGYSELWNKIQEKFSSCTVTACNDTIYDMGGPNRNYYDNEAYTYTISPAGASSVSLAFSSFSLGTGDTLRLYNGPSTASPLIGTYTSTGTPGTVTSTSPSITVKFKSDASGTGTGFFAKWNCIIDNTPPTTQIAASPAWATGNFTSTFTDADNTGGTGIEKSFYQVLENNGTEWRANAANGFFNDNFNNTLHADWAIATGTWSIGSGVLNQTDETNANTNIYTPVTQNLSNRYIYHWQGKISGTGTNRRAGIHFFSDDASLPNRGNSYFVWFRLDNQELQFYKVVNDVFTLQGSATITLSANTWNDYKIIYDRITGKMDVYIDNALKGSWTDPSPYSNGAFVSIRSGNCIYTVNDFKVYRSRNNTAVIKVGAASTNDIRYQNASPATPSGRIKSITKDAAGNLSAIGSEDVDVDWSAPLTSIIRDGLASDIDTTTDGTQLSANWQSFTDPHSGMMQYSYAIGTTAGDSNIVAWTSIGLNTGFTKTGLSLINGNTYYVSVRGKNNASLTSSSQSDGILYLLQPQASFTAPSFSICEGDNITFTNTSSNATTYIWNVPGGTPSSSTLTSPTIEFTAAGTFTMTLTSGNSAASDTSIRYVSVGARPVINFTANDTSVNLPNSTVTFTNSTSGAASYLWDFGDGGISSGVNPTHTYTTTGHYTIILQATSAEGCTSILTLSNYMHVYGPVGINETMADGIQLMPNPASGFVSLRRLDKPAHIRILDVHGKVCLQKADVSSTTVLDVTMLSEGVYTVEVTDGISRQLRRLVVVK